MSIKTRKSFLVGCMTGALDFEWGGRILQGALLGLQDKPYSLKVESVQNADECEAAVQRFIGARVAGIFAYNINPNMDDSAKLKSQLNRYKIPLICNNCRSGLSPLQVEADQKGLTGNPVSFPTGSQENCFHRWGYSNKHKYPTSGRLH